MDLTGRCCARCKSPYGHVEAAGRCCHPITTLTALEQMLAAAREETDRG